MDSRNVRTLAPVLTILNPSSVSLDSTFESDTDDIRPLLSPIVSEPDLETNPTTIERLMASPGDADDDLLLRSLRFASFSNTNLKADSRQSLKSSSRLSFKKYKDDPNRASSSSETARPYIFQINGSKIKSVSQSDMLHPNRNSSRVSLAESIASEIEYLRDLTISQLKRRRFFVVCMFSLVCMVIFNLIFMPRTTLNRDLRRLYGGFKTLDDISRIYLNQLYYNPTTSTYLRFYEENNHFPGENSRAWRKIMDDFSELETYTEDFDVFFGTPQNINIELLGDDWRVDLQSKKVSYVPYSANGQVTSKYVFVNYGLDDDYESLKDISLDNKIFIIRLKDIHPSLIVENAQKNGASGIIFYNDPSDDGKFREADGYTPYPKGKARSLEAINTWTSNFIYYQPGDPTTPGWSSSLFDGRRRLKFPSTIPKIPVIAMNHVHIHPILKKLNGIGPNLGWKGDLDYDYTPGPSQSQLKLTNEIEYSVKPIYNIVTEVPGMLGDEEIIIGASRDDLSGTGGLSSSQPALLEIARGFNELAKLGWKPMRTIKLISWDGSSLGMLGSSEHGEFHAQNIINNCIMYINLDNIHGTKLNIESNPLFEKAIKKLLDIVMDGSMTLKDVYGDDIKMISDKVTDYSIFENHLGIPSINVGFQRNPNKDPVSYQNSEFDDLDVLAMFDPSLKLHNVLAQLVGMFAIHISEHEIIDVTISPYLDLFNNKLDNALQRTPTDWLNRNMTFPFQYLTLGERVAELQTTMKKVVSLGKGFDNEIKLIRREIRQDLPWFKLYKKIRTAVKIKIINSKIKAFNRIFLTVNKNDNRISHRPWFRHLFFAPSMTNQGVQYLPGIHDALENSDFNYFEQTLIALQTSLDWLQRVL